MASFFGRLFGSGDPTDSPTVSGRLRRRFYSGDISPTDEQADTLYEAVKGDKFIPEQSYFSVRIVEMRLAQAGNYISNFLPMCCCFLRYTHGDAERQVPFIVGYDMIRAGLGKDAPESGAQNVEFKNIYVVRNAPVKPDGLTMYAALCRVADSSFARGMLDLLADAAGAIGGPAAGTIARTGTDMAKRLGGLLGAEGVSTRFGVLDGNALRSSCYRVFAGADSATLGAEDLHMERSQLIRVSDDGTRSTIDDADYLVVALEFRSTLVASAFGGSSNLSFHSFWEPVRRKLLSGDIDGADEDYKKLTLQIASSPDLTEADRLDILRTYRAQAEQWKTNAAQLASLKAAREGDITTRLMDLADNRMRPLPRAVADLLKSTSALIDSQRNRKISADAALSPEALIGTARLMRDTLEREKMDTSPETLAHASAQLLSAALSTPLGA
jgi:hypothetical protein